MNAYYASKVAGKHAGEIYDLLMEQCAILEEFCAAYPFLSLYMNVEIDSEEAERYFREQYTYVTNIKFPEEADKD